MSNTSSPAKRLSSKIALVTGGSKGIGAAIAKRLAAEGADVAISYSASPDAAQSVVAAIRELGQQAQAFKADAAYPAEVTALVKAVVQRFGKLNILVNNAGIFSGGAVEEVTDENYDRAFAVNVKSVFAAVREAAHHLKEGGRIITIGSVNGQRAPIAGIALYAATKFAVQGFTRGWAREFAPRGITVNVIQPGPVDTDLNPATGDFSKILLPMVPMNRYGRVDEIANLAAFLASEEASYITGAALNIDGGMEA
jgi:3-oxoacyl-[acyl-carrier protein] reductase